ncbi:MAG: S8/S53 family peptidase [Flavobacteriales bacterium]|nr:S8/S53 family peptidase [Flavobacteriales bacterium]
MIHKVKFLALLILSLACTVVFNACKDDADTVEPTVELEDDGQSEEGAEGEFLNQNLEDLESGKLKDYLDTNNLPASAKYVVLFKSSFQPPLAEVISKDVEDREAELGLHERNAKAKINGHVQGLVREESISHWFSVLSSGFAAELTASQVKALYRDENVKCIAEPPTYRTSAEPVYNILKTSGLFVHGYKDASSINKSIWIIDLGTSTAATELRIDITRSRSFGVSTPDPDSHGTRVSRVAAAKEHGPSNLRGIAPGARVVQLNCAMQWADLISALEYTFIYSKRGDIVNCSWGAVVGSKPKNLNPLIVEMENDILDFAGWDQPIVIAAGNEDTYASYCTPARLGMKYKDEPSKYDFIFVVANIYASGTDEQVKKGTSPFLLNTAGSSNYGRAIRYGLVGDWETSTGDRTGTSYSAPALCGILYHQTPSTKKPKEYTQRVKHKKGKTTYYYRVPKL